MMEIVCTRLFIPEHHNPKASIQQYTFESHIMYVYQDERVFLKKRKKKIKEDEMKEMSGMDGCVRTYVYIHASYESEHKNMNELCGEYKCVSI